MTVIPELDRAQLAEEFCDADVFVFLSLSDGSSGTLVDAALRRRLGEAAGERATAYTWDRVNEPHSRHVHDVVTRRRAVAAEGRGEGSHDVA